ncbi:MAG: hypothetical protein JWR22_1361 [Herminiimonas sp.]|nr:hypothetical protein [Herminiimonas sp.]
MLRASTQLETHAHRRSEAERDDGGCERIDVLA